MEKRFILAIVLSFVVLLLWQSFLVKKPTPQETASQKITQQQIHPAVQQKARVNEPPSHDEPTQQAEEAIQPVVSEMEENIIVETSLYRAVWSNKGAVLKSWRLKQHLDNDKETIELVCRQAGEMNVYPFLLSTDNSEFDRTVNNSLYKPSQTRLNIQDGRSSELRFDYADASGNKVVKTFVFHGGQYDFDVQIKAYRNNQTIEPRLVWGPSFGNLSEAEKKNRMSKGTGIAVYPPEKAKRRNEKKYDPQKGNAFNFIQWAAYENNYFAAIFILDPKSSSAVFIKEGPDQSPAYYLSLNHVQKAFLGPKHHKTLKNWGYQTKKIVNFGFFGVISEILYNALHAIHHAVPNWGFSIIILTLFIKILFFPLTYSSTKSMAKMQGLQPKIKALRAKHKKAKQDITQRRKMNEEMMKLYKKEGVNPAGGCLPLLIQIPIFWGFFRLLSVAVEFRHAPFILWIKDLSVMDPIYVIPILMGITQYISQKMTPTSADPKQQKMMLMMPVIMTVFFMSFQSGLVLYWLTNNVLQIGQQYITNRLTKSKQKDQNVKRKK